MRKIHDTASFDKRELVSELSFALNSLKKMMMDLYYPDSSSIEKWLEVENAGISKASADYLSELGSRVKES